MNYIINIFNKCRVASGGFLSIQTLNDNLNKLNADQQKIARKQLGNMVIKGTIKPVSTGYMLIEKKDENRAQSKSHSYALNPPIKPTSVLEF